MTDAETTKFIISPQLKKMLCSELQPADIVELVACLEVEEVHERMPRFKLFRFTMDVDPFLQAAQKKPNPPKRARKIKTTFTVEHHKVFPPKNKGS